jgi:1,4-dihydroxy-2-naphthoate octaprenyltransferase
VLLKALRAFSLPVSILPVFLAVAVALPPDRWQWGVLLASAAGAGLLHLAGNLLNDYFDYRKGVDRRLHDDDGRPGRQLVRGQLAPREILAEAIGCLALAVGPVGYVLSQAGGELLWYAVGAMAAAYAYTGPPLHLKYRALGEVLVFITFGPMLMLGAAQAQTGRLVLDVALVSIPVGMLTTAILAGNNFRDADEDASAGIRTLAQLGGVAFARWAYVGLICAAVGALVVLGLTRVAPWPVALSPLLLVLVIGPLRAAIKGRRLADIDVRTAQFETAVLAGLSAAFVIRGLL